MLLIDISACCQSFINLRLIQRLILKKFSNLSITPRIFKTQLKHILFLLLQLKDVVKINTDVYNQMCVFLKSSYVMAIDIVLWEMMNACVDFSRLNYE